jgi:predicted esterase
MTSITNFTFINVEPYKNYIFTFRTLIFYPKNIDGTRQLLPVPVSLKSLNVFVEKLLKTPGSQMTILMAPNDNVDHIECLKISTALSPCLLYSDTNNYLINIDQECDIFIDNCGEIECVTYIVSNCITNSLSDSYKPYSLTVNKTMACTNSDNIMIERVDLDGGRFYLYCVGEGDIVNEYNLLVFHHGSRDLAWNVALKSTLPKLLPNYIIVYAQASLEHLAKTPSFHPAYGNITFGEIYWEIRDHLPEFVSDIEYTRNILSSIQTKYNINKIFSLGHSNGGVFNLQLAIHMPNIFTCIISHMGGIGFDVMYRLDFDRLPVDGRSTSIHLITGEYDEHRMPSIIAKRLFDGEGFPTAEVVEYPNTPHQYLVKNEYYIAEILQRY